MAKLTNAKPPIRLLLIGESGVGKTTSLACLADLYEIGVIDIDCGMEPLVVKAFSKGYENNIRYVTVPKGSKSSDKSFKTFSSHGFNAFVKALKSFDSEDKDPWGPPSGWGMGRILVIDSLSALGSIVMAAQLEEELNERKTKGGASSDQIYLRSYQYAGLTLEMLVAEINNSVGCHVVYLAHPRQETAADGTVSIKKSARTVGAKTGEMFPAWVNHCCTLSTKVKNETVSGRVVKTFARLWQFAPTQEYPFLKTPASMSGLPGTIEGDEGIRVLFELMRK